MSRPKGVEKKKAGGQPSLISRHSMARARASVMTEMSMKGVPQRTIGDHFGISQARVQQVIRWADENGVVEEVRERMRHELLPKAEGVYRQIFATSAEVLSDKSSAKGYELKLKAAKQISEGVGAFRRSVVPVRQETKTLDLEGFFAMRRTKVGGDPSAGAAPELPGGDVDSGEGGMRQLGEMARELPDVTAVVECGYHGAGGNPGDGRDHDTDEE